MNIERKWNDGRVRLTLFKERTNNAIISQTNLATNPVTGAQTPTTTISNVAAIRMQGVELSAEKNNVLIKGLQLFGSVTYVEFPHPVGPDLGRDQSADRHARRPWSASACPLCRTGAPSSASPIGRMKAGPIRSRRATAASNIRRWITPTSFRMSTAPSTTYFVVDMKVHYNATKNFSFDFGIDNLFNEQYFLFHPFPGRTYVLAGKYTF